MPFFGAFGAAGDDAMVARWSAHPLGMLWPERDAAFVMSGGVGLPTVARQRRAGVSGVEVLEDDADDARVGDHGDHPQ